MKRPAKIGLYGGSFDPPHKGHRLLVERALAETGIKKLIVMPCANPPHKKLSLAADERQRLEMTKLMAEGIEGAVVSDYEIGKGGRNYTIDTVKALLESEGQDKLALFVGGDMLLSFSAWRKAELLAKYCDIYAFMRNDGDYGDCVLEAQRLSSTLGGRFSVVGGKLIEISSAEIRAKLAAGEDCGAWLTAGVYDYIKRNRLYV